MNGRFITYSVGKLLEILSLILFIPAGIAFYEIVPRNYPGIFIDHRLSGFLIAIAAAFLTGTVLKLFGNRELSGNGIREGFAIVTFGWVVLTLFGAIPLLTYFLGQAPSFTPGVLLRTFTDSYFEIMSGFTTTGATIIENVEALPRGILFWRSLTHWLGGMGIVTLALAILPAFGIASYQMFRGEVPGPSAERLRPRLAQTAKILWGVYALLTLAEAVLLKFGGMTVFDSLCHAFGTMATGGFSTRNASIGAYDSSFIDWVVIVFMFFAGMNFIIHYRVFFGRKLDLIKNNREFHFYAGVLLTAILLGSLALKAGGIASPEQVGSSFRPDPPARHVMLENIEEEKSRVDSPYGILRHVTFQVVSITTTTGYATADSDMWPNSIRFMLVVLMFFGGCAGSTGGGMKMIRVLVFMKAAWKEIKTIIQPRIIAPIKIAGKALEDKQVMNIMGFIALFMGCFVFFSAVMSYIIEDFTTAVVSVVATMCNIGPGLSGVGATENYAWIPLSGKWVLTACMLIGRLEIYTVLIVLSPLSWKK
jgi:trk system potassium uptake protein TrkH